MLLLKGKDSSLFLPFDQGKELNTERDSSIHVYGKAVYVYELNASISYSFSPLCDGVFAFAANHFHSSPFSISAEKDFDKEKHKEKFDKKPQGRLRLFPSSRLVRIRFLLLLGLRPQRGTKSCRTLGE